MHVKVVVMNHNHKDSVDKIYKSLSCDFDVSIFDSGSEYSQRSKFTTHIFPNIYWTGCWDMALDLFAGFDVIWVLGGDVKLLSSSKEYLNSIKSMMPFGCWSPKISGRCRPFMNSDIIGDRVCSVYHVEGIAFALGKDAFSIFNSLPFGNDLGWGQDIWMCYRCWRNGLRNIIDGRVALFHPESCGYSGKRAFIEMDSWFSNMFGSNWRNEVRHWYEDFGNNFIKELVL